jgi:hypothetical protein
MATTWFFPQVGFNPEKGARRPILTASWAAHAVPEASSIHAAAKTATTVIVFFIV